MKKLILPILLLFSVLAKAQTPKMILDKYVDALGGMAAIKEINNITQELLGTVQGQELTMTIKKKIPNKLFMVVEVVGMGEVTKIQFDGTKGKMIMMGQETKIDEKTADSFKGQSEIFHGLSLYSQIDSIKYVGKETIDSVVCDVLKYKYGSIDSQIFFDEKTGLLLRQKAIAEIPTGKNEITFDFKDYRPVGKLKYPFVMKQDMGIASIDFLTTSVKFNQNMDDKVFVTE